MKKTIKPVLFGLTMASLIGAVAIANAADRKNYTAAACQVWAGTANKTWGYIESTSTTANLGIDCPIVKDGNSITAAKVDLKDRHTTDVITCTLYNVYIVHGDANVYYWNTPPAATTSAGAATYWLKTSFTGLPYFADANGAGFMSCNVPKVQLSNRSAVGFLSVTEDNTDSH